MINFLERILVFETLEKIFRLQAFLYKASVSAAEADIKVIAIYNSAVNEVLKSIEVVIKKLHDKYGALDEYERFSCMRRISNVFNSVDDLHSQLRFIYGEWTVPETYIFVSRLFKSVLKEDDHVSIVLSDSYMFEEVDLSRYLEWRLNYYSIPAELGEIRPTLLLPKIEYTNPLNWAILIHEMGHTLTKPLERIFSDDEITKISSTAQGIKTLESWTEEIWCDLIALKLLGPSYLASYITFAVLLASSGGIEDSSPTHPADRFRISIMRHYLDKMDVRMELQSDFFKYENICDFFDDLFEERCQFERDNIVTNVPPPSQFPVNYQKFRDFIIERIDDLTHDSVQDVEIDSTRVRTLTKRLSDGILIGSSSEDQDTETLLSSLAEIKSIQQDTNTIQGKRARIDHLLENLFAGVEEKPCSISEIVNAGWQYKCENLYTKMIKLFFIESESLSYCYDALRNEISWLDDKLKKSIEISYIHNLFSKDV